VLSKSMENGESIGKTLALNVSSDIFAR